MAELCTQFPHLRGLAAAAVLAGGVVLAPTTPIASAAGPFPAFTLPVTAGQQVASAGVHSDASAGVQNAIDLSPADKLVRAPLAGTARLQHCEAGDWVTIDHRDGWRTGYYHLEEIAVTDGQAVEAGTVLGQIGNALPCGGSSSGPHVHFTLWTLPAVGSRSADAIAAGDWDGLDYARIHGEVGDAHGEPVNGKVFGGWRFEPGDQQYSGTAVHVADGETVRLPGEFQYRAK